MTPRVIPLPLILCLLVLAGPAWAMQISNAQTFAILTTPTGTVTWATNVTMDIRTFYTRTRDVQIDGLGYNFTPSSSSLALWVTHWTADKKAWNITSPANVAITFVWSNPGGNYTLSRNGTVISTCLETTSVCWWNTTGNTHHQLKLTAPGVDGICGCPGQEGEAPASSGGGGGGGFTGISDFPLLSDGKLTLPPLPSPIDVFPQMNAFQWLAILVGFVLLMNGFGPTRAILPSFLVLPVPPPVGQLSGALVLTLTYLS